eukprot:3359727-Pleurochrysis_carterae.AAC.6
MAACCHLLLRLEPCQRTKSYLLEKRNKGARSKLNGSMLKDPQERALHRTKFSDASDRGHSYLSSSLSKSLAHEGERGSMHAPSFKSFRRPSLRVDTPCPINLRSTYESINNGVVSPPGRHHVGVTTRPSQPPLCPNKLCRRITRSIRLASRDPTTDIISVEYSRPDSFAQANSTKAGYREYQTSSMSEPLGASTARSL